MNIINEFLKIVRLFDSNPAGKFEKNTVLLNSFLLLSLLLSISFLVFYIVIGNALYITALGIYIAGAVLLFFLNNKKKVNQSLVLHGSFILTSLLVLFLSMTGGSSGIAVFWAVLMPIAALTVFGSSRESMIYSAVLFLLIVILFVLSPEGEIFHEYSLSLQLRFTAIYLTVLVLAAVYAGVNHIKENQIEKQLLDFKKEIHEKDQSISDLSFKLRSPLNHLVGILNLKDESGSKELIDEIELSVDNLVNIVNSIPSLSGVKSLKVKKRRTLFALQKNIKKTLELYQNEGYSRLKMHLNLSGQLPSKIYADISILKQIIISVIDFFYTNSDAKPLDLEFIAGKKSVSERGCEILFKVQSTLPLQIIEEKKGGNFINNIYDIDIPELEYIDRQIKKMNGKLNLYSDDSGTAFLFSIEAEVEETKNEESETEMSYRSEPAVKENHSALNLKDVNLLLVEDDKVNQKIMVLTLKKYVKSIEVAQNGKEAIELYGQKKYDIILMDIRMPFMDGYKTTKKIRETEAGTNMHVPIIAVTANALEGDREKCLEAGMDDYMSKPLKTDDLLQKMQILLSN